MRTATQLAAQRYTAMQWNARNKHQFHTLQLENNLSMVLMTQSTPRGSSWMMHHQQIAVITVANSRHRPVDFNRRNHNFRNDAIPLLS